jgi:hypothetical protein
VWCVVATDEHIYSCGADKTIIAWSMAEARRGTSTQVAQLAHQPHPNSCPNPSPNPYPNPVSKP